MSKKQDDAAKVAGLIGIVNKVHKEREPASAASAPTSPAPPDVTSSPITGAVTRSRARRSQDGKRSDPNYKLHGVYVRKDLHKSVKRRLEDAEDVRDFSALVEELLERWLRAIN